MNAYIILFAGLLKMQISHRHKIMNKISPPYFRRQASGIISEDRPFYEKFREISTDKFSPKDDKYYTFGYETFGIILYGFSKWMIADLKKRNIKKILFLARDGFIMQEAFHRMPEHEIFQDDYLYISRRSIRVPLLWKASKKDRLKAIFPTTYISISDLITSVGLNPQNYAAAIAGHGLKANQVIRDKDIDANTAVAGLIDDIWDDVTENSKKEYEFLIRYLEKFDLSGDIAIVDIGWRGSMQYFLNEALADIGIDAKLHGYYITLSSTMIKGQDMKGYLGNVDGESAGCDLLRGYVGLIETMFLKAEGSTVKYQVTDSDVFPVLGKYEYADGSGLSEETGHIMQIQKGAIDFIKDLAYEDCLCNFSPETAFKNLSDMANYPTLEDIKMFGWFRLFNNGTVSRIAGSNSAIYNITHLKAMKGDLYESRWRIGFMKRMLKIPFPYYGLFKLLMKAKL